MDYNYKNSSILPLLSLIQTLGNDIKIAEIGTGSGTCAFHALQECPNIKTYYAIDPYCEYVDHITYLKKSKNIKVFFDARHQDTQRLLFKHRHNFSSYKEKIKLIEKTSKEALSLFEDNSLDFIFHDAFPTYEDAIFDFNNWFTKLKNNGIYSGHDYKHPIINKAVEEFAKEKNLLSVQDCWFLIKNEKIF